MSLSERSPSVPLGQALALWSLGWSVGGILFGGVIYALSSTENETGTLALTAMAVASWTCLLVALWTACRMQAVDFRTMFGLSFRWIDLIGIPIGVLAQVIVVPLIYVPLRAIWPSTFDSSALEETAKDLVDSAGGWKTILLVLVVVVGAPFVEELVYRGLLQRSASARFGSVGGLFAASIFFGLIHLRPVELPGLAVAGLVFGIMLLRTGRLGASIITHASFNATGIFTLLLFN